MAFGVPPTSIVWRSCEPSELYSVTAPVSWFVIHTPPSPTATDVACCTGMGVTRFDVGSIREMPPPVPDTTHTLPSPAAIAPGPDWLSAEIRASTRPVAASTRITVPVDGEVTQRSPSANTAALASLCHL